MHRLDACNAKETFGTLASECAKLGVPSLASIDDVSRFIGLRHACRVEQLRHSEMPRLMELLDAAGVALPQPRGNPDQPA